MSHQDLVFTELVEVAPVYCSGVAHVSLDSGNNVHIAYFREQPGVDGNIEHVIVARLIMPQSAIVSARQTTDFEITSARELASHKAHGKLD